MLFCFENSKLIGLLINVEIELSLLEFISLIEKLYGS